MAILKIKETTPGTFQVLALIRGKRRWLHTNTFPTWTACNLIRGRMNDDLKSQYGPEYFEESLYWTEAEFTPRLVRTPKVRADRKAQARAAQAPTTQEGEAYRSPKLEVKSLASIGADWLSPSPKTEAEQEDEIEESRMQAEQASEEREDEPRDPTGYITNRTASSWN